MNPQSAPIPWTFSGRSRPAAIKTVVEKYADYIGRQVLALDVLTGAVPEGTEGAETLDIDGLNIKVLISKS